MPLDYQSPDPKKKPKSNLRVAADILLIVFGIIVLLGLVLLGTCALLMRR